MSNHNLPGHDCDEQECPVTRRCSCAFCLGIEPWASNFARCIQQGWIDAADAVEAGIASRVPDLDDVDSEMPS
jgi:hypothetical protein